MYISVGNRTIRAAQLGAACALLVASALAGAAQVMVISLGGGTAQVVINDAAVHTLRPGQTSPEGVKLLSVNPAQATFEANGKRFSLGLGESNRPSLTIAADARGHFLATAYINGAPSRAMVDTGASAVALSAGEAYRLGISFEHGQPVRVRTASGSAAGYRIVLDWVQVGTIAVPGVEAIVHESVDSPPLTLLGMSFLRHLDMAHQGSRLTLTPRQ